jgi:hypothetical protein
MTLKATRCPYEGRREEFEAEGRLCGGGGADRVMWPPAGLWGSLESLEAQGTGSPSLEPPQGAELWLHTVTAGFCSLHAQDWWHFVMAAQSCYTDTWPSPRGHTWTRSPNPPVNRSQNVLLQVPHHLGAEQVGPTVPSKVDGRLCRGPRWGQADTVSFTHDC